MVKNLPAMQEPQETQFWFLDQEDPLGTHSSILAWRTPRTEEPDRLQFKHCKELDLTEVTYHAHKYFLENFISRIFLKSCDLDPSEGLKETFYFTLLFYFI